jgi:hypothetical protein
MSLQIFQTIGQTQFARQILDFVKAVGQFAALGLHLGVDYFED